MSTTQEVATVQHQQPVWLTYRDKKETIKQTVAKGASDAQLEMFLTLAERYQLDPFLKEIWFNPSIGIITGRDGYLKIAQRDQNFDGMVSAAVCEGDSFSMQPMVPDIQHSFGAKRGAVIGGYAVVFHKKRRPAVCYAPLAEYQKTQEIWQKYRSAMICKVAEVFALKRQFGINGLVTEEEVGASAPAVSSGQTQVQGHVLEADVMPEKTSSHAPSALEQNEQKQTTPAWSAPAELKARWKRMAQPRGIAEGFKEFEEDLTNFYGEDGYKTYHEILARHGIDPQTFKGSADQVKRCTRELFEIVQKGRSAYAPKEQELFPEAVES